MKIIIITQGISKIIDSIIRSNHEVIGIIESGPRKEPQGFKKLIKKAISGVYLSFNSGSSLRDFAKKNNIPYYYFKKGDDK